MNMSYFERKGQVLILTVFDEFLRTVKPRAWKFLTKKDGMI